MMNMTALTQYPVTRKEAINSNLKHYFTGQPCKHGHVAIRFTSNGLCQECHKIQNVKLYYKQNGKEKQKTDAIRLTKQKWRQRNKGTVNSWTAFRYARKKQRTPLWLSDTDIEKIKCYYQVAAMYTKEGIETWSVDHIVPLNGNIVSGLHVPYNLRVIPQVENSSKGNNWNWETQSAY